jgi:hypothetical protein
MKVKGYMYPQMKKPVGMLGFLWVLWFHPPIKLTATI